MALTVFRKDDSIIGIWAKNIQSSYDFVVDIKEEVDNISMILVNGEEYHHIIETIKGIPTANKINLGAGSFRWYGDIAKTIVANL